MKSLLTIALAIAALLVCSPLYAGDVQLETLYGNYVDKKIDTCEVKAARINAGSTCVRRTAELGQLQANFYQAHREQLIREMVTQGIGTDKHQVDHFLIKSFRKATPGGSPALITSNP